MCPVCHHKITAEYLVCPNCHTKLHKKCEHCGRILNLKWNVCPYCAEPQAIPSGGRLVTEPPPPARERRREPILQPVPVVSKAVAADGKETTGSPIIQASPKS